jgi:hypothetical protein
MDDDPDFRDQVHGQADVGCELTEIADRLHVDLLFLDLEADLFLDGSRHILRGDGAIQLACFTSLGAERPGLPVDLCGQILELRVLLGAADLSLRTDSLDLLERAGGGEQPVPAGSGSCGHSHRQPF